jgi:hypothetical protein
MKASLLLSFFFLASSGTQAWVTPYTPVARPTTSLLSTIDNKKNVQFDLMGIPEPKVVVGKSIPYQDITIGVLKETFEGENRVSQTPDSVKNLVKAGFQVVVQSGGTQSFEKALCWRDLQLSLHDLTLVFIFSGGECLLQ